jgi:hypothetical protein
MTYAVFCVMTTCSLVGDGEHFAGTYCFHLQGKRERGWKMAGDEGEIGWIVRDAS